MLKLRMTLAEHNALKAHFGGKATGIQAELKKAGFDVERHYPVIRDKDTGDLIFTQAKPKPIPVKKKEPKKFDSKRIIPKASNRFKGK